MCKSSLQGDAGVLGHMKGRAQRWHPPVRVPMECSSRLLNVCIKLYACPSGQCFNVSRWSSLTLSLGTWGPGELGPGAGEYEGVSPFRAVSQVTRVLWVLGHNKPCCLSQLDVLVSCLSSVCLFFLISMYLFWEWQHEREREKENLKPCCKYGLWLGA